MLRSVKQIKPIILDTTEKENKTKNNTKFYKLSKIYI